MARPPGLPPMPRRRVTAAVLAALMLGVLVLSVPMAWRVARGSGWDPETVIVILGTHALFLGAFGWMAWMFWAGRRPGDGG